MLLLVAALGLKDPATWAVAGFLWAPGWSPLETAVTSARGFPPRATSIVESACIVVLLRGSH